MIFATHVPRPPLNQFIELFWFHEGFSPDHSLERVLPDGSVELIINLRDEDRHVFDHENFRPQQSYRRSWLSGPHSEFIVIDTALDASMIGAHFRPGGASAFFGMPLSEIRNSVFDLGIFWNGGATSFRDRLLEAPSSLEKFRIFEDALLARYRGTRSTQDAVSFALNYFMQEPGDATIAAVAGQVGYSRRHFIQLFNDRVGMTPKVFCRVRRFQRALNHIQRRSNGWATLGADCGFYDQPHLIRDFKEFCGMTPVEYAKQRLDYPNFVPIR
jgi:AraC-like DNA-binding protein